jgi:hypothetical protein
MPALIGLGEQQGEKMRLGAAIMALLLLAAGCADSFDRTACYKSVRSASGKSARALAATPCPPGQHGIVQ